MLRRRSAEINNDHDRWLVSYADFITLLFAFFVVMYALSQLHENKYRELSQTLTRLFSASENLENVDQLSGLADHALAITEAQKTADPSVAQQSANLSEKPLAEFAQLEGQLIEQFADLINDQAIKISYNEQWLEISLNNRIVFPLGSIQPNAQAQDVFASVAAIIRQFDNSVQVEGFTDNLAINTKQFPSNWELSSARAVAIVKLLIANGVSPSRLAAVGYAEFQPIADNATPRGRAENRRVVLMIGNSRRHRSQSPANQPLAAAKTPVLNNTKQVQQPQQTSSSGDEIIPITLENGELLFTSDPASRRIK